MWLSSQELLGKIEHKTLLRTLEADSNRLQDWPVSMPMGQPLPPFVFVSFILYELL